MKVRVQWVQYVGSVSHCGCKDGADPQSNSLNLLVDLESDLDVCKIKPLHGAEGLVLHFSDEMLLSCLQEPAVVVWVTCEDFSRTTSPLTGVLRTTDCTDQTSGQEPLEGLHHPAGFEMGDSQEQRVEDTREKWLQKSMDR